MPVIVDYYQKPPFGTKVNLSKSICTNMLSAFMSNEGGGIFAYDSITGQQGQTQNTSGVPVTNFAPTWTTTPYGPCVTTDGAHQFGTFQPFIPLTAAPFSVAFFGTILTNNSVFSGIWGTGNAGILLGINTSDKLELLKTTVASMGTGSTLWVWPNSYQSGGITYDGATVTFYYNGNNDGTSASVQTFNNQNQSFYGGNNGNVLQSGNTLIYVYVWKRVLSPVEFKTLAADPFYPFSKKLWGFKFFSGTLPVNETLTDTLSFSDAIASSIQPAFSLSDQIILSDAVLIPGGGLGIPLTFGDTFVFNDANSQIIQLIGNLTARLSDQISLSDAESNAIPIGFLVKDNKAKLSLSDSVLKSAKLLTQLNDTLTITDFVQDVLMPIANLQFSESLSGTMVDQVGVTLNSIFSPVNLSFTEQLALNDLNLILKSPDYLSVVDSLNLQDSVIVSLITDLNPYIRRYLNDVLSISNPSPSSGSTSPSTGNPTMFYDDIIPSGAVNGSNTNFTLPNAPNPPSSLELFLSGVLQIPGTDFTITGVAIVFTVAPKLNSTIVAYYRG